MNGDFLDLLNKKISEPEGKLQLESILGNLNTVSDTLQWVKTLQETGMAESLKGVAYLLANLRGILTDDMLNGVSSMLNSLLEVLSKISDPQVVEGLV